MESTTYLAFNTVATNLDIGVSDIKHEINSLLVFFRKEKAKGTKTRKGK